jgi:hypothetical protein
MELRLHLHRGLPREVDWFAAGVAGFAAGALLMVLELTWTASMSGEGPWRVTQLVAALILGPQATLSAAPGQFSLPVVTVALATHYALGVFSGFVVAWVLALWHRTGQFGAAELVGAVFGAAVYVVNFHLLTALVPWFAELRGWSTFAVHVIFGLVTAVLYVRLARRGHDAPAGTA